MDVSHESSGDIHRRLLRVLGESELQLYPEPYTFEETPACEPPLYDGRALALVRDDGVWSHLVPARADESGETYRLFRFHFPEGIDNSGFVGWLATRLKQQLGTGIFVVCGHNSAKGGVFDYWGCPWVMGDRVLTAVRRLRQRGRGDAGGLR